MHPQSQTRSRPLVMGGGVDSGTRRNGEIGGFGDVLDLGGRLPRRCRDGDRSRRSRLVRQTPSPRARLMGDNGKTREWKSQSLPAYQRRTKAADALIAEVQTAEGKLYLYVAMTLASWIPAYPVRCQSRSRVRPVAAVEFFIRGG